MTATRLRPREVVLLKCSTGCGAEFELTARADFDRRRDGRPPVCRECRNAPAIVVTDDLVDWWRAQGWTPEEALPLAEVVFGPRELWTGTLSIRSLVAEAGGYTEEDFREIMSA